MVVRILWLASISFCLPSLTTSSLAAFDCSSFTPDRNVRIVDILPQCDAIRDAEAVGVTIFQSHGKTTVVGYRCKVTFTQILVDIGSSRIVSNGTETLNRSQCLLAHETKVINISGSHIPFLDTNGTVNHTLRLPEQSAGNTTHQYHYLRTYEITLSENFGTVDLQQNIVRFDNDVVCDNEYYSCHDDQLGQIFWHATGANEQLMIYQGPAFLVRAKFPVDAEVHYVVLSHRSTDKVFVLKSYDVSPNGGRYSHWIYRAADIPNTYIMETEEEGYYGGLWGSHTEDMLNGTYSEPHYGKNVQVLDIVKRCCESEKQRQYSQLKSLPLNSRIDFAEKGLVGLVGRDYMVIERCAATTVRARQTEECFREIPVRDTQNRDRFLDAKTRVLSSQAETIPCGDSTEPPTTNDSEGNVTNGIVHSPPSPIVGADASVDWVKILALVIICGWACTVLVRLVKVVVYYFSRSKEPRTDGVEEPPIFSVSLLVNVLKPPFMKNSFKWRRHNNENEPDLNVSYAA